MTEMNLDRRSLTTPAFSQMSVAGTEVTPAQRMPPDWRSQHPVLQMILDFAQPILLRLAQHRNVRISVTRNPEQTSLDFSFLEDSLPN